MRISIAVLAAFFLTPVAVPLPATAANLPSTCLPGFTAIGDNQPTYDPSAAKVQYSCMSSQVKCPAGMYVPAVNPAMNYTGYWQAPLRLVYSCMSSNGTIRTGRQLAEAPSTCVAGFSPNPSTYNPNLGLYQYRCTSPPLTCPYSLKEAFDPDPMHPHFIGYTSFNTMVYTCFHEVTGIR